MTSKERNNLYVVSGSGDGSPDDRDEALAALLSLAGNRRDIPPGVEDRVRAGVETEWRRATAMRRTVRWAAPLALAASMVLAVAIGFRVDAPAPGPIGQVARVTDAAAGLLPGDAVNVADMLETSAAGGLSFVLEDDTSVRLAPGSTLRIDAEDAYTLLAGAVYVDTGGDPVAERRVGISTGFGTVTDVGTQFAVTLAASGMEVAVREGRVDIATGQAVVPATAGRRVTVASDAGTTSEPVSPSDAAWQWVEALAPQFRIEGKSVLDFLSWVARETGMELEFGDPGDRRAAETATLHGSIDDLTPMEALVSVMPTTRFSYVIDGDAISVRSETVTR
jgi:hypothetical protein